MSRGTVYLVGAGPGDPSLLTLKAAELLRRADAVVYDRLVHPDTLALARRGARLLYVGKEGDGPHTQQDDIHRTLIAQARLGRLVVRLKGGDPFVFGRGGEEALALAAAGVPVEVVPGVTSGTSVPALAGIPVTHRGLAQSVTFATARGASGEADWEHLARAPTLVLFMCGNRLGEVAQALVRHGKKPGTPAAVIEAGSLSHEQVVEGTLGDIAARAAGQRSSGREKSERPPSMLVVGDVVGLRAQLGLRKPKPKPAQRPRPSAPRAAPTLARSQTR